MAHVNTDRRPSGECFSRMKKKPAQDIGYRLVSDVEAAVARSLQFCMPVGSPTQLPPCTSEVSLELHSPIPPLHACSSPSWGIRGSRLTGNIFVDYRRIGVRRLEDLKVLQRSRETEAIQSLSLTSCRALSRSHSAAVTRLSLDYTRRYLLSSSRDGSIALYDLEADAAWNLNGGFGPEPKVYPIGYVQRVPDRPPKRNLLPLRFQPASGRGVMRGHTVRDDTGRAFDFAGAKRTQAGHSRSVTSVEFMPGDNGLFVSTGLDKLVKDLVCVQNDQIWDTQAWECVLDIAVDSPILCCAFDRVGFQSSIALSSKSQSSVDSMEHSVEPSAHLALAAGCEDGSVRIFDMRCGVAQQTLLGHKGACYSAACSGPLAVGHYRNLHEGKCTGAVLSVTWDPATPCQFFSGSSDKSIRKWDIRRNDACVVIFDKGKPDLDFFRNRCSQSSAFRQLLYTNDVVGGSCSAMEALGCGPLGPPPSTQYGLSISKDRGVPLHIVARAAARAAFAQEPLFSLPCSSSVTSVISEARQTGASHPQIPKHTKKHTRHVADLGREIKRTRIDEPTEPPNLLLPSKPVQRRDPLKDHQLDCFTPEYLQSEDVVEDTMRERDTTVSAAVLGRRSCGGPTVSRVCRFGNMVCDEAPNNCDGLDESTLQTEGNVSKVKTKRRIHAASTDSSPKCRVGGSTSRIGVHSESASFPARIPISLGPGHATPAQNQLNQGSEAGKTGRDRCSSFTEREPDSGESHTAIKNTRQARGTVGRPVCHADSPCVESTRSLQGGTAGTCINGNSTSDAIALGQLLCNPVGPREAAPSLPGGNTWGNFGRLEDRSVDQISCLHSDGYSASTFLGQNAWCEISAHEGAVTCLVPTPDGAYLVSSGSDGRIRLWNALSGSHCFVHMSLNIPRVNSVVASVQEPRRSRGPGIPAGPTKSKTVSNRCGLIWGIQAGMSRSGEYLIHGRGRVLCTFDIMSGAELQITAPGYSDDIVCVTWNDEKNEAYSGACDGSVLIYDAMCESITCQVDPTIYVTFFPHPCTLQDFSFSVPPVCHLIVLGGYTSEDTEELDGEEGAAVDVTPLESL